MQKQTDIGPKVLVEQVSRQTGAASHLWVVGWRIRNLGDQQLRLMAVRLPHSQFRSGERELHPFLELPPGESVSLELVVECRESPGSMVENAFLILRVFWSGESWRILARLRVLFDEQGAPKSTTEVVTTQPVGFSIRGGDAT